MSRIGSSQTFSCKGFTLVEIMLTVTILSIGLIGILRAYAASLNALDAAQESIESSCLLKDKMAEIELKEKEDNGLPEEISHGRFGGGFDNYQWELDIHSLPGVKLNEATVTVYRDGHTRRYSLVTYVYEKR